MLILAGVSLNAIIGDNGIITNAQNANIKSGMAVLEEFLQEKYVENYEKFNNDESKVYQLQTLYPAYFYIPSAEGVGGLRYIVDSKGHALYLIKKIGLPKEIREQLIGGNAGSGTYTDYATLNDVYGVTADLKVYYSEGTGATLFGLTEDDLDNDNPQREVFNSTMNNPNMYSLLAEIGYDRDSDGKISAEEVKSVDTLTIGSNSGVTNLLDLYNLTSLEKLTITNKNLSSLDGIQNCTKLYYLYLNSSTIGNYSALVGNAGKLKYLYIYNIDDGELSTLCDGIKTGEFSELHFVKIVGETHYITKGFDAGKSELDSYKEKSAKTITNIGPLSSLHKTTKKAIQYLALSNNNIGKDNNGSKNLVDLSEYTSLLILRLDNNAITSLKGLENMNLLSMLFAPNNLIGKDYLEDGASTLTDSISALDAKSSLSNLNLENNPDLKYVDYLAGTGLTSLYLKGCNRGMNVNNIASVILNCGTSYSLPCKFLNGNRYVWTDYYYTSTPIDGKEALTASALKSDLKNNSTITILDLKDCKIASEKEDETEITDGVLNEILKTMSQLKYLRLDSTYIENLDFCDLITKDSNGNELAELEKYAYCPNLIELSIRDTYVTDISNINNVVKKTTQNPDGRNMGTLCIGLSKVTDTDGNRVAIPLDSIQDVISGLTSQKMLSTFYSDMSLILDSMKEFRTLVNCSSITTLKCMVSPRTVGGQIDLTGMKSLKLLYLWQVLSVVKIPNSCQKVRFI